MMRIILRRRVRPDSRTTQAEYRQIVFKVARLTIGRAPDRHVHIEHPDVLPKHAVLYREFGRLRVRALGAGSVHVNGSAVRKAPLRTGDVMTFGAARLTVEQLRPDGVTVLRLNDPQALSTAKVVATHDLSLKGAGLDPRPWSWLLVVSILSLGFIAPLAAALISSVRPAVRNAALLPSDVLWQPGPLHEAHRAIGHDCNVCHSTAFQRVPNEACEACHKTVHQHVAAGSPQARLFAGALCADCHIEHDAQKDLIERQSAGCIACHGNLKASVPGTQLPDVTDFSSTHPAFGVTLLVPDPNDERAAARPVTIPAAELDGARQQSNLIFSHKVHLDPEGIGAPEGRRRLQCAGCHQTDAGGRAMLPIRMEKQCAECHTLQFDEHDPGSKVPHGDLAAVFKALREHFSRRFLDQNFAHAALTAGSRRRPGDDQALLSREDQRRALAWADEQTTLAARELLEKRVCVECHKIAKVPGRAAGPDAWDIAPVRLTQQWFPHALFNHTAHKASACDSCHHDLDAADDSASIHMPTIATCRRCHGDDERRKVTSTCVTCHDYHRPEAAPFVTAAAPGVSAEP